MSKENQVKRLVAMRLKDSPDLDQNVVEVEAINIRNSHPLFNPDTVEEANEEWIQKLISTYGVFSVCEAVDQILLWSHYADCHRGFAVEFSKARLRHFFIGNHDRKDKVILGYRVNYLSDYPVLIPEPNLDDDKEEKLGNSMILTKSISWSYEKEYRYLFVNGPNRVMKIPKECITGLYLGLRIPEKHRKEILEVKNSQLSNVSVYQAKKKFGRFGLEFVEIV